MSFAVIVDGDVPEGQKEQAYWVLSVDPVGERFLMAASSEGLSRLRWVSIAECRIGRVATPDQPMMVVPVQPERPVVIDPHMLKNGGLRSIR